MYGTHPGLFKTPARESDLDVSGAELNATQLVWLRYSQQDKAWRWSVIRPGVVGSPVPGNATNPALSIALYVSPCKALGLPLRPPDTLTIWYSIVDHADADLLTETTLWVATSPAEENRAFSASNDDTWHRCELWPHIAQRSGLGCAPPVKLSFHQLFNDYRVIWRELTGKRLMEVDILRLSDGQLADFVFGWQYGMFSDGSRLRRAGFQRM